MRVLTRRGPFLDAVAVDPLKGPMTVHVDLRGLSNPEPVLALAEEAARLAPGGQLEVVTDDPCASSDFLRWLAGTDIELVEVGCLPEMATGYLFRRPPIARRRHLSRHTPAIPRRPDQSPGAKGK
jgi:TusA-related sulfurtransferase